MITQSFLYKEKEKPDISSCTIVLSNSLTYTGAKQTQNIAVQLNGQTLTPDTDYYVLNNRATNAGTYTLIVYGTGEYQGIATSGFTIAKAISTLSLNTNTLTVDEDDTGTITITTNGDGVISAVPTDSSVCTATVEGNVVTVTGVSEGTTTLTVNVAAGDNYLGSSATCSIEVEGISPILSENTPDKIKKAVQQDIASTLWAVGDRTAPITISASNDLPNFTPPSEGVCAFILGFDHNSAIEGTGITFMLGKTSTGVDIAFVDSGYGSEKTSGTWFNMNNSKSNSGGWSSSRMRTVICPAFLACLPSEWQNIIAETNKYTNNTGGTSSNASTYVTKTIDKLFLLSEYERYGMASSTTTYEWSYQAVYNYYTNGNSRVKYKHNATSTACEWDGRSPSINNSTNFNSTYTGGNISTAYANISYGFAPAFRIA